MLWANAHLGPRAGMRALKLRLAAKRETGVAMVETAIVAPMIMLLVFGVLEFGLVLNNQSSLRQGVRDAARQGVVGNYGSTTSCNLTGVTGSPSTDMRELMCMAKAQAGIGNNVRVNIKFLNPDLTAPAGNGFTAGNGLVVCTAYQLQSVTGLYAPILNNREITAKAVFRIEQTSATAQTGGGETDPTGLNWSWCNP